MRHSTFESLRKSPFGLFCKESRPIHLNAAAPRMLREAAGCLASGRRISL